MTLSNCDEHLTPSRRLAHIGTVVFICELFFALEENIRVTAAHRRMASTAVNGTVDDSIQLQSRQNTMLSLIFNIPLCLMMMQCIAASTYAPSSLSTYTQQQRDEYSAMDRQRLVFTRLLSRILTLQTRWVDEKTMHNVIAPALSINSQACADSDSAAAVVLCLSSTSYEQVLPSLLTVIDCEQTSNRGQFTNQTYPFTFFCVALSSICVSCTIDSSVRLKTFAPNIKVELGR